MSIHLPRVFFDSNTGTRDGGYMLVFAKSREDLNAVGDGLNDGLKVLIYMPHELEAEAILRFDHEYDCWIAKPVNDTWRQLDNADRSR